MTIEREGNSTSLVIHLFGPFEVWVNGNPLPRLRSRKVQWLLALLALRAGVPRDRSWLAGVLWPDSRESTALATLRRDLVSLRQALGPAADRLRAPTRRTLCLDLADAESDLAAFEAAITRAGNGALYEEIASSLEQAVALYRGPLLEGCTEEWAFQERQAREQAYLAALERLAADATRRGDHSGAAGYLGRTVAVDPLRESAQRALMQVLAAGGNAAAAIQAYRELHLLLQRELNLQPDPETQALLAQIRAEARAGVARGTANRDSTRLWEQHPEAMPSALARHHNLPVQRTPLLGREQELAAARDLLLREPVGLVTLTGPGGTGKTRLALEVAEGLIDAFEDGVFFVDLAPIRDPSLVPSILAQTLGVRDTGDQPLLVSLQEYLRGRQVLLLLDNFEQVLEAAPVVAEMLGAAPRLKVLVTSRAALRLRGEQEFPVPPLSVPDPKCLPPPLVLSQYAAVELFIQRAVAVKSGFVVTSENAPAVAEICHRLDGLPLAIELAAARIKLFSPEALLCRLQSGLNLLTGGARDLPSRQRTLQSAIAWSCDLLQDTEKTLFRRLSVFAGGFTLEAAASVCNGDDGYGGAGLLEMKVLDGVASLFDQNLLRHEEGAAGEPCFRMLETIREY